MRAKIEAKEYNIGDKIAPKPLKSIKINNDGNLSESTFQVYGRKIPLHEILQTETNRLHKAGVLKIYTDDDYENMSANEVNQRLKLLGYNDDDTNLLKSLERRRHIKLWHDHSDILNHTYINFMVSYLYDPANFLTNEEYRTQFPFKKPVNVQTIVERPNLYIFGQSASTDSEQITYINTRLEDISTIHEPTTINGIQLYDVLRVFSGDSPARQFEAGQQRGGNYSCLCGICSKDHINLNAALRQNAPSLEERRHIVIEGEAWQKIQTGVINPFQNLKKQEIINELDARNIEYDNVDRAELKDQLTSELHGIVRPPALMVSNPKLKASEQNLDKYEVLCCEPLHDVSSVVQHLLEELPHHIDDKNTKAEYEKFSTTTIGDKNQLKGSDTRLFAIKLAKFTSNQYSQQKVSYEMVQLVYALVEIINIAYSPYSTRSPKKLLRLYNQCFIFSILCRKLIENPVKMSIRKFYGIHFHALTTHLPQIARVFNTKAILTEQEERSFGDLRKISQATSNRKPGWIVTNALIRFHAQNNATDKINSLQQQDSIISQQARLLPIQPATIFTQKMLSAQCYLFEAHMARIADFIQPGEGIWWHRTDNAIVFHNGSDHPSERSEGPTLAHFRQHSIHSEIKKVENQWQSCLERAENRTLIVPLVKIKMRRNGKLTLLHTNLFKTKRNDTSQINTTNIDNPLTEGKSNTEEAVISENEQLDADHSNHVDESDGKLPLKRAAENKAGISKDKEQNLEVKEMYKSYVKVVRWRERYEAFQSNSPMKNSVLQVSNKFAIDVTGNEEVREQRQNKQSTTKSNSLTNGANKCKRKLFEQECSEGIACPKKPRTKIDLITNLIGNTEDVLGYQKYKGLLKKYPGNASFQKLMDISQAKMQNAISKRHNQLKAAIDNKTGNISEIRLQKTQAEQLLDHWGYYHY